MARRTCVEFEGPLYHVINLGNSRCVVCATAGAATPLETILGEAGKTVFELVKEPKMVPWKIALAAQLREQVAAPYFWLVHALSLGHPTTLRSSL